MSTKPKCDMTKECTCNVTHIDNKGFLYCENHGIRRSYSTPCRKLRDWELKRILNGQTIPRY